MTTDRRDLISLVEKLRQEQAFCLFYKTQVRQTVQDINQCCDRVFHSLWLSQCLGHGLEKVKSHHAQSVEWTCALEQVDYVEFVDAAKILRSSLLIENYGKFLNALLNGPSLLAQVLMWAESEGLDSTSLVSDIMSVIFGHCVFQHDHILFLSLLKQLLRHLVSCADTPKELFSGVESIFCRVLTEYCNQLVDLRTFVTEAFQGPLTEVLLCEEYLEFDVNKAGTRFQSSNEGINGHLLDGSAFLFSEDLDNSCEHLAKLAMQFINGIRRLLDQFPLSLKWVVGSLKTLVRNKWPNVSAMELRRPVSAVLFGPIFGSTIVNPDYHGICEMDVVVGSVARYNLSQIASILQGCSWVLERQGGKFPMQKVIKKMNTKAYCSLLDTVDGGYGTQLLDLPSSLPGLRRSAFLASQEQLNNLVGLVCEMAGTLAAERPDSSLYARLDDLKTQLPPPMKQLASATPYSLCSHAPPLVAAPTKPLTHRSDTMDPLSGGKTSTRKKDRAREVDMVKSPMKQAKKRSSSTSNLHQTSLGGSYSGGSRVSTRSISPNQMLQTHPELSMRSPSGGGGGQNSPGSFHVPAEVMILPLLKDMATIGGESRHNTALWDFALLSEEEFMSQNHTPTFRRISSTIHPSSSTLNTSHNVTPSLTPTPTKQPHTPPASHALSSSSAPELTPSELQQSPLSSPVPICPSPIPEVPNPNGMESGHTIEQPQNGTDTGASSSTGGSAHSPVKKRWAGHRGSGSSSGTRFSHRISGGSDSSLNTCVSSREPSSSPSMAPKKRSFTVTSLGNGKFALRNDLSPLLRHSQDSIPAPLSLPSSPPPLDTLSPTHIPIITTSSPPFPNGSALIANMCSTSPPPNTVNSNHIPNGAQPVDTLIKARLNPSESGDRENTPDRQVSSKRNLSPSHPDLSASDADRPSSDADTTQSKTPDRKCSKSVDDLMEGLPDTPRGKGKKKWFRRKKKDKDKDKDKDKRKVMKTQMSLQERSGGEKMEEESVTKPRSKSAFGILDSPEPDDLHTHSHNDTGAKFNDEMGELKNSPRAVFKKNRSYSIMTAPILAKYTALVEEQRRTEAPPTKEDSLEALCPRFESLRVKEMTPHLFQRSLFCSQLEYKLRAALQNMHTPLTSSPVYLQLRADEDSKCDSKYQLTTLLQCALQRSKWIQGSMEIALITETLRMVEQIPNTLVGVALERAHEEQDKRSAYTNYLVHSHMKFQDVRLQVGAMQTAVDRMLAVLKEQFVQLAVRQFLDSKSEELGALQRGMADLSLADERCSLMEERLEDLTEGLLEDQTWRYWPRGAMEVVSNCLEDQLFSLVYHHVFHPNMDLDRQKDEIFSNHLTKLSEGLTPTHRCLQISPVYHSGCPWLAAQKHLKAMALYKSPRGKVRCIAESCRVLISLLQYAKVGSPPGADDLFPVLVYVLIKANPPGLLSTTQYVKNFLEDSLKGEENYWWVQFSTAVEFTKTLE